MDLEFDDLTEFEPYEVTCARCGKVLMCTDAVPEEGDEWECFPCNDKWNAIERAEIEAERAANKETE